HCISVSLHASHASPYLHPFPTRRSSDLTLAVVLAPILCSASEGVSLDALVAEALARNPEIKVYSAEIAAVKAERRTAGEWQKHRSEEHTSELQSPDHLVCRLLLEKKKNI